MGREFEAVEQGPGQDTAPHQLAGAFDIVLISGQNVYLVVKQRGGNSF
jgi:hypothetical protein